MEKEKEIIEGNVLIAYFIGGTKQDVYIGEVKQRPQFWGYDKKWNWEENPKGHHLMGCRYSDEVLEYHHNWSWLMLAVEKIQADKNNDLTIYNTSCLINISSDNKFVCKFFRSKKTKIRAVWLAVVDYIKWFNAQNICV